MGKINVVLLITMGCYLTVVLSSVTNGTRMTKFVKGDYLCKLTERLRHEYSWIVREGVPSSKLFCLSECSKHKDCKGASLDGSQQCFLHGITPGFMDCGSDREDEHAYWEKYCVHGGWNPVSQCCSCDNDVSGKRCNVYFKSCKDLTTAGYSTGFYNILLDFTASGKHPMKVECHVHSSNSASVVLMRNKGMDFNKTWHDFQTGFSQDGFNNWIGLWNWYGLNNQDNSCRSIFMTLYFTDSTYFRRAYYGIKVDGPDSLYKLNFETTGTYQTTGLITNDVFGDCLKDVKNVSFSTWDKDNDNVDGVNCASVRGSGWWLDGCDNVCNLMGWGIGDWNSTKQEQRLSVGVNIQNALGQISHIEMFITCQW